MASDSPQPRGKGVPIKIDQKTYDLLDLVARVEKRPIADLARELIRVTLPARVKKLESEIEQLRKMDAALDVLAEKARKKVAG